MDFIINMQHPILNPQLKPLTSTWLYIQNENGTFSNYPIFYHRIDQNENYTLLIDDYNNDAHLDVLMSGWLYYGDGNGDFYLSKDYNLPKNDLEDGLIYNLYDFDSSCRDFNNDNNLDILSLKQNGEFYLFTGNTNGNFDFTVDSFFSINELAYTVATCPKKPISYLEKPIVKLYQPNIKLHLVSGNIIIKGRVTGIISEIQEYILEYGKGKYPNNWNLLASGNDSIEGDLYSWDTTSLNGVYSLRLKGIDKQGNLQSDLVVVDIVNQVSQSDLPHILYGNSEGIYRLDYNITGNRFTNKSIVGYPSYGALNGIAIADFDNDGDNDYVTGRAWDSGWGAGYRYKNGYITIHINDGDNNYSEEEILFHDINFNGNILDFTVGDFNNDGWMDFVFSGGNQSPVLMLNQYKYNNTFKLKMIKNTDATCNGKDNVDINGMDYLI